MAMTAPWRGAAMIPFAVAQRPAAPDHGFWASTAPLLPFLILGVAFFVFCLIDLVRAAVMRYLPKWAWAAICLVLMPLGGIVYLSVGKTPRHDRIAASPDQPRPVLPYEPRSPTSPRRQEPARMVEVDRLTRRVGPSKGDGSMTTRGDGRAGPVPWLTLCVFFVAAELLAWVVVLPLWLSGGLDSPWLPLVEFAMMLAPAVAALVAVVVVWRPKRPVRVLGVTFPGGFKHQGVYLGLGLLVPPIATFAALAVAGLSGAGVISTNALAATLPAHGGPAGDVPLPIVVITLALTPINAIIGAVAALGEEIGWRGLLLPALRPLGTWPALVLSGAIWGLWHTPIILLGYHFDQPNILGVINMVILSVLLGAVLGWLRMRSGAVWAPALAHGGFNAWRAAISTTLIVHAATGSSTPLLGWSGWVILAVIIAILAATRQFRWTNTDNQIRGPANVTTSER